MSSNNNYCSTSSSSMPCYCVKISWLSSWVLSIGLVWSLGYSKRTEFNFCWQREILAWRGSVLDVSVFLLKTFCCDQLLWFFWRRCYLADFFFMNNGNLNGKLSGFPSCCIINSLTTLLLSPHPIHSSFRYEIDEFLGIW